MSNISTVIGSVVGVFIALLVGLALFGEVANQTAELGESGDPLVTESYDGDPDTAYDLELVNEVTCTYSAGLKPYVRVTVDSSSGGVATISAYQVPGTVQCAGLSGNHDARLALQDGSSATIGEGAILTVSFTGGLWNASGATLKEPGRARVISGGGANLSSFIALSTILNILPTVVLVGLLSAGGVIGGFIGRSAGGRFA